MQLLSVVVCLLAVAVQEGICGGAVPTTTKSSTKPTTTTTTTTTTKSIPPVTTTKTSTTTTITTTTTTTTTTTSTATPNPTSTQGTCRNPTIRREWNQLSATEKNGYIAAVKRITARPRSNQYADPTRMSADDFSYTHAQNAHWAHANAEFLVFHRAMLRRYEQALESVGWKGGLVYLDEGAVPTSWQTLDLFSSSYFGSMGSRGYCLPNGQFSGQSGYKVLGSDGTQKCISRCGSGTLWSAQLVARSSLSSSTTYDEFRGDDTSNFHGSGHIVMGGQCDMGNALWSPRDPLFYLHHAYVDKLYWKWQQLCPNYVTDYQGYLSSGVNPNNALLGNSQPVNATLPLDSWVGLTAADVFDTRNDFLCYTYSKSSGDVDFTAAQCKNGAQPNTNPWSTAATNKKRRAPAPKKNEATARTAGSFDFSKTNNSTQVTVTCGKKTSTYTLPTGCEAHKIFCSHISLKPIGSGKKVRTKDSIATCPLVLRPSGCDKVTVYTRPAHLKPPGAGSLHKYPTFMTDEQIQERGMDHCSIRASDVKVMQLVDEMNAAVV
ncbi:hypothetical protein CcCBS67573_g05044 [Chytriomyces confervae]|uniref:Tyrosinase copper-binding domain-containing protein n=1 Tax=Chytriomyces confervae TaxID=246404 RepID=A0A507FDN0_9FUNG|nr:hypothetical protein HDU80_006629 [Chytriomyces hyalinus]TPX73690.1 hypothetical protein CcCBS67573_g05044 [Chytriomyces confervae]